jgi:hypothetical protein
MTNPRTVHEPVEMPASSWWPFFVALSIFLIGAGILSTLLISGLGIFMLLASVIGWTQENRRAARREEHDDGQP